MIAIQENPLASMSDSQIIMRLDALVQKERETTLEVLRHIIEFARRKLYLGIGYGSLFEYCTRHLGYSESAANRRIKSARCMRNFPEIYEMLAGNELNLSIVCRLFGILSAENKTELLREVRCQSVRRVDEILARYRPANKLYDHVRPVYIKKVADVPVIKKTSGMGRLNNAALHDTPSSTEPRHESAGNHGQILTADVDGRTFTTCTSQRQRTMVLEKKYKLEFAVSPECMKKLEEAKAILSRKYPDGVPFGKLLEEALDTYLDKNSPERKKKRREKRKAAGKKQNGRQGKRFNKNKTENDKTKAAGSIERRNAGSSQRSRHIPHVIRDEVLARDEGRCTYVGPDGARCSSKWNVEIDHIKPYAQGGDHAINNLRLLCARHNQYEAVKTYGKEFMERRIGKLIPTKK